MAESADTARAVELDDVIITVGTVRYSNEMAVIRLDLDQQAFDGKSYVDLSVDDAMWLVHRVAAAAERVVSAGSALRHGG